MTNYRITFICDEKWLNALKQFTDVDIYDGETLYVEYLDEVDND